MLLTDIFNAINVFPLRYFINQIDKINALLGAGADLNVRKDTQTPLHAAARMGNREIVELFLSKGAKKNVLDSNYFTASRIAEINGHRSIAALIDNF